MRGPILQLKSIWRYLGFFFDWKLNFHYHVHYYAIKCLLILNTMKILGNLSRGILSIQKHLLYRTCVLLIVLYRFQLWFFKDALTVKSLMKLKRIQCRAALWITRAFCTLPLEGIKAIVGPIPINLYFGKLNGRHYLQYTSISPSYTISSLLDYQHTKNQRSHKYSIANLHFTRS